ncbi:hypothetical protein BDV12DRAFT_35834 [Aspergillus spectabilis]
MTSTRGGYTLPEYLFAWLLGSGWRWILLAVYMSWWGDLKDFAFARYHETKSNRSTNTHPNNSNTILWLESKGYLHSPKSTLNSLIFHLILLALELVEGYWLLTSWYRTLHPVYKMSVPDYYFWGGTFANYWGSFLLPAGLVFWCVMGLDLAVCTVRVVHGLRTWEATEMEKGGGE